jgi:hypothetical protein
MISVATACAPPTPEPRIPPPTKDEQKLDVLNSESQKRFDDARRTVLDALRTHWNAKWILSDHILTLDRRKMGGRAGGPSQMAAHRASMSRTGSTRPRCLTRARERFL